MANKKHSSSAHSTDAIDRFIPQVNKKNFGSIIDVEELVENGQSDLNFVKIVSVQDVWKKDWKMVNNESGDMLKRMKIKVGRNSLPTIEKIKESNLPYPSIADKNGVMLAKGLSHYIVKHGSAFLNSRHGGYLVFGLSNVPDSDRMAIEGIPVPSYKDVSNHTWSSEKMTFDKFVDGLMKKMKPTVERHVHYRVHYTKINKGPEEFTLNKTPERKYEKEENYFIAIGFKPYRNHEGSRKIVTVPSELTKNANISTYKRHSNGKIIALNNREVVERRKKLNEHK